MDEILHEFAFRVDIRPIWMVSCQFTSVHGVFSPDTTQKPQMELQNPRNELFFVEEARLCITPPRDDRWDGLGAQYGHSATFLSARDVPKSVQGWGRGVVES